MRYLRIGIARRRGCFAGSYRIVSRPLHLLDICQLIQLMATTNAGILPAAPRQDAARGILLMLAAVAVFSTMDALIKYLTANYSPIQIIFFRNLFAFVPIFP